MQMRPFRGMLVNNRSLTAVIRKLRALRNALTKINRIQKGNRQARTVSPACFSIHLKEAPLVENAGLTMAFCVKRAAVRESFRLICPPMGRCNCPRCHWLARTFSKHGLLKVI